MVSTHPTSPCLDLGISLSPEFSSRSSSDTMSASSGTPISISTPHLLVHKSLTVRSLTCRLNVFALQPILPASSLQYLSCKFPSSQLSGIVMYSFNTTVHCPGMCTSTPSPPCCIWCRPAWGSRSCSPSVVETLSQCFSTRTTPTSTLTRRRSRRAGGFTKVFISLRVLRSCCNGLSLFC